MSRRSTGRGTRLTPQPVGPTVGLAITWVIVLAAVLGLVGLAGHVLSEPSTQRGPGTAPAAPAPPTVMEASVAGYGLEQLGNACTILTAGRDLGMDERDQTIAVMTAMGESSLRNLEYGDWETSGVTNPDGSRTTSIGLFQQQDGWGSREARLEPYSAATMFYRAMAERVPERATIEPTLVAHRTQINAEPRHYERYWERAQRVVAALNGAPMGGDDIRGVPRCSPAQP
ncbi:peptidase M23 [Microbacterium sp. NPDC057407]|uniref:peptidase M23 n=1 Tax=Microbacterium sp. NPDC057407 TaxID=3346120 RepID=UPI0036725709